MMSRQLRTGILLALTTALISGVANFVTKIAVTSVKQPVFYTTLKNALVAIALIGAVILVRKLPELKRLTRRQWMRLLLIGTIGGSVPFALYFTGLAQTSALNASLIHKTLFIWVAFLAIPFLKERLTWLQWSGMAVLLGGNLVVGGFQGFKFNVGEVMILGATLLWAVENIIAKRALKDISPTLVAGGRMVFGSMLLIGLVVAQGNVGLIEKLTPQSWWWTILSSVLLLGYVLTWYTALSKAPATVVATLLVPATLVTNALSAIFVTHSLNSQGVMSIALFTVGTSIVVYAASRQRRQAARVTESA